MSNVSLEFLAAQIQRVLEGQNEIRSELAAVRERLTALEKQAQEQRDENVVTTGLVLRYAGEHIAWGGVQSQLTRLQQQIDELRAEVRAGRGL